MEKSFWDRLRRSGWDVFRLPDFRNVRSSKVELLRFERLRLRRASSAPTVRRFERGTGREREEEKGDRIATFDTI